MNLFEQFKKFGFTITTADKIPVPAPRVYTLSIRQANAQMDAYSKLHGSYDPDAPLTYQTPWYAPGLVPTLNLSNTNMFRS
jgi:hypothetical protein